MQIRKQIHSILIVLIGGAHKLLCKLHVFEPKIICHVDGGICSQMFQYMTGEIFAFQGEKVLYDLTWFSQYGWDVERKHRRKWELEVLFPDLHIQKATGFVRWFYRYFQLYSSADHQLPQLLPGKKLAPIYLGGYYDLEDHLFAETFRRVFANCVITNIPDDFEPLPEGRVRCAVHVRRGDLAKGDNPYYGGVTDDYFYRAIDYVESRYPHSEYVFFSDEMDYVRNNLVPNLSVSYLLMDSETPGYVDLVRISRCDVIISSQGSFGKYASMMNENSLLILQDDKFAKAWLNRKEKAIAL